jgi:hypothetical protein
LWGAGDNHDLDISSSAQVHTGGGCASPEGKIKCKINLLTGIPSCEYEVAWNPHQCHFASTESEQDFDLTTETEQRSIENDRGTGGATTSELITSKEVSASTYAYARSDKSLLGFQKWAKAGATASAWSSSEMTFVKEGNAPAGGWTAKGCYKKNTVNKIKKECK